MRWFVFILLLTAFACKSEVTVTEDEVGADVFYAKGSHKPFTGRCTVAFNNSPAIKEQFIFRNGLLHGESLAWYRNGQLRRKGYYNMGQISGKWIFWDEQGNKIAEAHYKADILDGSYIALYTNGRIKEKGHFAENKRTGKWSYYSEDGKLIRSKTE